MNGIIERFQGVVESLNYEFRRREFDDGLVGYYGEMRHHNWSGTVHLWDLPQRTSVSAGIFVPILDQVTSTLFPSAIHNSPREHRIIRIDNEANSPDNIEDWIEDAVRRCDSALRQIQRPADLAPFLATKKLMRQTRSTDWSRSCSSWIALTYLGKGLEAARATLQEELRIAKRISSSKLTHAAIDIVFFRRKPKGMFRRAEALEEAISRLSSLHDSLPQYNPNDFDFAPISLERDKSAFY